MEKKRGAWFVAIEKKDHTIKHSSGINVSTSATNIPKVCMAFCPKRQQTVMVGYDPTKPSIYVDEWGDRFKDLNMREVAQVIDPNGDKIQIKQMQGKYVKPTEYRLLEYLRIVPFNKDVRTGENADYQPATTASFYELNFEAQAKTRRSSDKEQTKAKALVYQSDYETKKSYCIAKGINTKTQDGAPLSDAELEDILAFKAEQNPETFQKEYNNPYIWNAYYIRLALERGLLQEQDGGRVLVDNQGAVIKSAPVSQQAVEALAKGAATNVSKDAHAIDTIRELLGGEKKQPKKVEKGDLFDTAVALGIIEDVDGIYVFEGSTIGSSKTSARKKVEGNDSMRTKISKLIDLQEA